MSPLVSVAVTPGNLEGARSASNVTFEDDDDEDSDSDFDEENLTPKVRAIFLLACANMNPFYDRKIPRITIMKNNISQMKMTIL